MDKAILIIITLITNEMPDIHNFLEMTMSSAPVRGFLELSISAVVVSFAFTLRILLFLLLWPSMDILQMVGEETLVHATARNDVYPISLLALSVHIILPFLVYYYEWWGICRCASCIICNQ